MKKLCFFPLFFVFYFSFAQESKDIIGNPIKLDSILIAQNDFPKSKSWANAKKACSDLGEGWRLPTKDELNILYKNKERIGGFISNRVYWSSTEDEKGSAWFQVFLSGFQNHGVDIDSEFRVRAVKTL
jgi:hypothetical protein